MPLDIPDDLQKAAAAKSINDQINYYIQILDTKASYFLAGNVAAASFLLPDMPSNPFGKVVFFAAIICFATSILVAGGVIFPRRPKSGNSIIFWGDISGHKELKSYVEHFNRILNEGFLDEQYCVQNYFSARLMRWKFRWLRCSICFFFAGLFCAFIAYWTAPHP